MEHRTNIVSYGLRVGSFSGGTVMRVAFLWVLLTAGLCTWSAEKPNILFLLSDDHSYPGLGCYGDTNVDTPNLDRLADEGMKFHRFFTCAPQCVPSRASLMTGRSPVACRITRFSSPLPRDEITFPELLRQQAGYFVGVCGRSYHLDGSHGRGADGKTLNDFLVKHNMKTFQDRFDYVTTGRDTVTPAQTAEFLDRKPAGAPFFLWVNFSDPHHPWTAPDFAPDPAKLKLPPHWPDSPGMRRQLADYYGEVNRVDRTVRKVLDIVEERGFKENTIVVFAGDNGQALPHGKGSLYDPGLNVPFVIRWPGIVKPGTESRELVSGEDLAPTLLEAAGLSVPDRITGKSILPLLQGQPFEGRKAIFAERGPHGSAPVVSTMRNSGYDLSRCVRSANFKFIYNCTPWLPYSPVDSAGGAAWREITAAHKEGKLEPGADATYFSNPRPVYELYDLETDPSELNNLAGNPAYTETERELRAALTGKMILDFDYLPLPAQGPRRPDGGLGPKGREGQFLQKDTNHDKQLSWSEFSAGRDPEEAKKWFDLRDVDGDGVLSREEFIPLAPLKKKP